jgi:hypothetical protein
VAAVLQLYFPADEATVYGPSQSLELYCGKRPSGAQWQAAFESHLSLGSDQAGELAAVASLPLQARLAASLSLGNASLTLSLDQVNHDELDDALFQPPPEFALRKE